MAWSYTQPFSLCHTHTHTHTQTHKHSHCTHTYMHTHVHTCTHTHKNCAADIYILHFLNFFHLHFIKSLILWRQGQGQRLMDLSGYKEQPLFSSNWKFPRMFWNWWVLKDGRVLSNWALSPFWKEIEHSATRDFTHRGQNQIAFWGFSVWCICCFGWVAQLVLEPEFH